MATFKKYNYNPVLVGTGTYKFRPYTVLSATVPLTTTLVGCTLQTATNAVNRLGTTSLTFKANVNYRLPTSVQVTGATAISWDYNTGVLVIEKPTLNEVNVKVVATSISYSITENLTNVVKASGGSSINAGGTATLTYTAAENYELPDTVTVTGATYSWSQETGALVLSNPTGNVTVAIAGVYLLKIIATGTYQIVDEPTATTTHAQFAFTTNGASASGIAVTSTGISYDLAAPMGKTQVYTAATKVWTLPAYRIVTLTEEAHTSEVFYEWWSANTLPKLATPQNVTADGTTVSWDEVENATSYEIYADGISFGDYTPAVYTQSGNELTVQDAQHQQDGSTVTLT